MIANSLFITGSWKTTWTWIEETGKEPNGREEKRTKSWKGLHTTTIGNSLYPGSCVGSRSGRKKTQETKETDTSRDEDSRKSFPAVMLNQGLAEKRHRKKRAKCKPSRDEDSRKSFPAVMLNQGLTEKRHGRKRA